MSNYRFTLEATSKKYVCPNCNKKRFVRYVDTQENIYVGDKVGRCDREFNCGYHLTPKDFYKNNGTLVGHTKYSGETIKPKVRKISSLEKYLISKHGNSFKKNNFIQSLKMIFNDEQIKQIISKYLLGTTSNPWQGSVIFWQIDDKQRVRSGKIINYNRITGNRIKKPYNHVSWIHKTLKIKDFNLGQCLFGLHLINEFPNKPIAIVESEKSACIMSVIYPKFLWLSCGSLSNINIRLFEPIRSKDIVLYPDLSIKNKRNQNAFDLWVDKANILYSEGFKITVSKFLYKITPYSGKENGFDIADYFISEIKEGKFLLPEKNIKEMPVVRMLTKNQKIIQKMISKNQAVKLLIKTFDLDTDNIL
ncbi:DUF6371 domain-containing protein [Hyunsoonleella sp. 2307UL5-6]|uniref:DUF6371 domain-containing protein n=1 Tax=Hyunsoonleella sp. 2307UL5-6 TaxID=3384768 RepID=UPI0039BD6383